MISSDSAMITKRTAVSSHIVLPSPIGPLTLVAEDGKLTGLYMDTQAHRPDAGILGGTGDQRDEPFASAARQLRDYFAGRLTAFDLPLAPAGTQFQRRVWAALQAIPYGQTWSYGQLAREVGNASASRAVGLANGRNPDRRGHPLPPGDRLGREPDRLRWRPGPQAVPPRSRSRCGVRTHASPLTAGESPAARRPPGVAAAMRIFMQAISRICPHRGESSFFPSAARASGLT